MVTNTTNVRLSRRGMDSSSKRVFLQRWLELWHHFTIDSYSTKLMNSHGVLSELISVIADVLTHDVAGAHLEHVYDESRMIFQDDPAIADFAPAVQQQLIHLLSSFPKSSQRVRLLQLNSELGDINSMLDNSYLDWLIQYVEKAFDNDEAKEALRAAELISSEIIQFRDRKSVYDLGLMLLRDFDANWIRFKRVIKQKPQETTVFLPLTFTSRSDDSDDLESLGISLVKRDEVLERGEHLEAMKERMPALMAVVNTRAGDYRSAAHDAYDQVSELMDISALEKGRQASRLDDSVIVDYAGLDGARRATKAEGRRVYRHRDYQQEIAHVKTLIQSSNSEIAERVRSSMQYISLSTQSHSLPVRYINAWVALESLVRGPGRPFENMEKYVPCIHSAQYVQHLLSNFIDDCTRCEVKLQDILELGSERDRAIGIKALIRAMNDREGKKKIVDACDGHDLLRMRAETLIGEMRSGPRVARLLNGHHKRIVWHFFRLYRIRNSIVHAGIAPKMILPCITHLYDYVFIVLRELCKVVNKHRLESIHSAMALIYNRYKMLIYELESNGHPSDLLV